MTIKKNLIALMLLLNVMPKAHSVTFKSVATWAGAVIIGNSIAYKFNQLSKPYIKNYFQNNMVNEWSDFTQKDHSKTLVFLKDEHPNMSNSEVKKLWYFTKREEIKNRARLKADIVIASTAYAACVLGIYGASRVIRALW